MIKKKYIYISAAALTISIWPTAALAQDAGVGLETEVVAEAAGELNVGVGLPASDRLLERALETKAELSAEAQAQVVALQESIAAVRAAWENEYYPGVEATVEEIEAAREQFKADLAAEIEATKELRKQVVVGLRDEAREGMAGNEVSAEARLMGAQYKELALQLSSGWREVRAELGSEATEAEVEAARDAYLEANADLIAERKGLAAELRLNARAEAEVNRPTVERGELPAAVAELKAEIATTRGELRESRLQAAAELRQLSQEERETRRQELAQELRAANEELKEKRKQLVDDLRGEVGGERRADG